MHLQTIFFSPGREPISFELLSLAIICFCHSQGAVLWQRGVCHSYDLLHGFRTQIFLVASSDNFFYLDENRSLLNCSHLPFSVSAIRQALFSSKDEFAAAVKKETETLRQQVRQKIAALPLDRKEGKHFKRVCRQSLIFAFFFMLTKRWKRRLQFVKWRAKN